MKEDNAIRCGAMGRRGALTLVLVLTGTLLALRPRASALDPRLDVNQYAHTAWRVREGFAKGEIFSVVQTPDGYLWLGTQFGLLRFDGVKAVPWQPPGGQHLLGSIIRSLLVTRDGTLWIGADGGLASWKDGKLIQYPEPAGHWIFKILEDREGTIWASGYSSSPQGGRLCAIRSSNVQCYGEDGTLGRGPLNLYEDSKGNLWAGVTDGLWRWRPGPPKFYPLPGEANGIQALGEDTDGTLLVGRKGGIYRFVEGKAEVYPLPGLSLKFAADRIIRDRDGGLWIGTTSHGLVHAHKGGADVFAQSDSLSGDIVDALFEDREGSIWIATINGLDRFRDFAAATFTLKQGLSKDLVGSVLADRNGTVWLGTYGGLNKLEHGKIVILSTGSAKRDGKLNGSDPNSLFQDDRGRIWISTQQGLGYWKDGRFTSVRNIPGGSVLSIAQDNLGNLWVIHEAAGLFRVSPRNDVLQIPWSALRDKDHASVLSADRKQGGLWIGFFLGGIVYFADGQVRASYTAGDGLGEGRVSSFLSDHDGTLWISTAAGLSRLKDGRLITLTSKNGLPCDTVHWVMEDDDHSFWLYTACGLIRINRSELDAWVADPKRMIHATVFDSLDGVRSLASPGHFSPQVAQSPDGRIWFLPWDGVSVIDPRHLPLNKLPPPVHIEQITADRKTYDATSPGNGQMRLPPLVHDLQIDYTALSLVEPEKVLFRYKLEGVDRDWRDAGNRRQAFYTDLSPRKYTFRVMACNNSGVWNEAGTSLNFVVLPAYYQTLWFRSLCVLVFLALVAGMYRLRVRQLAEQFNMRLDERVQERTRIARELHDTLLQSFHGLLMNFQTAWRLLPQRPTEAKESLACAIEQAEEAIIEGRGAVEGLRASTVQSNDLALAIRTLGEELATDSTHSPSPTFRVTAEGVPRDLHPVLRDEVYRVAAEALRNAFRHAQARQIEVEIRYDNQQFRLQVRDDGRGFDPRVFAAQGREGHYGLPGMHERAKIAGGKLTAWSEVGAGTEVELQIPASTAYAKAPRRSWLSEKLTRKTEGMK